jgi:S1-C subfamily serine protease
MTRRLMAVGSVLAATACATGAPVSDRGDVLRRIVPSTVQLRAEAAGGVRRSGSGVVVASDPVSRRSWILTTFHVLGTPGNPQIFVRTTARGARLKAVMVAHSADLDLAVLEIGGITLPRVEMKDTTRLGDEVWVIGFPWGRRMTVVSGIVSQIASAEDQTALEGPARMVDASVSYGASGAGVFEASSGALIGVVEGYRTARVTLQTVPERTVDVPVPGETTVIAVSTIRQFLSSSGIATR